MQQLIMKSTKDDNIQIHPHCNSPYCSQKIIELNPSIGCEYQCQYCCLYTQEVANQFNTVTIYKDYPNLLVDYIEKNNTRVNNNTFFLSFESDCFQKSLIEAGITQAILEILKRYKLRYFILTKGGLPPNSGIPELLIDTKGIGQVIVNDTMPDENYRQLLEPLAAPISDRYNLVQFCIQNNIVTTVSFSPIFPFINLDYVKEKMTRYSAIGIKHFRFDMLELSIDSYKKIVEVLPEHASDMANLYLAPNATENAWNVPNSNTVLKRYKPNKKAIADIFDDLKQFAESIDNNTSVSICDATIAANGLLAGYNKKAYSRHINCMVSSTMVYPHFKAESAKVIPQ